MVPTTTTYNDHNGPSLRLASSASDRDQIVYTTLRSQSIKDKTDFAIMNLTAKLRVSYATACHASLGTAVLDHSVLDQSRGWTV